MQLELVTIEHLIKTAKEKHITKWSIEPCAVCDYPIHYLIRSETEVLFDCGCHCSDVETMRTKYAKSSWQDIADEINKNNNLETKKFWNL